MTVDTIVEAASIIVPALLIASLKYFTKAAKNGASGRAISAVAVELAKCQERERAYIEVIKDLERKLSEGS